MSTPRLSSRKPFLNSKVIFILFFLFIVSINIAIGNISQQQEGTQSNKKIYEDNLMIAEGDKFSSVEYNSKFVTTKMKKKSVDLKLKFLEKEIESSYRQLLAVEKMTVRELGVTADYRNDLVNYNNQYLTGVYKKLYSHDSEVFDRVAELFKEIASEEKLSGTDTVNMIASMVQNIRYEVPKLTSFQVLSPTLCINYRYGDCDTKTLLLLVILRKVGVDCVHLSSDKYSHAMIGINVPSTGEFKEYRGVKYYFLETTNPGWYIGALPPEVSNKTYWVVLDY